VTLPAHNPFGLMIFSVVVWCVIYAVSREDRRTMTPERSTVDRAVTHVCAYVLEFSDGGPDEARLLHAGTLEECDRTADSIPAASYNGDRPVRQAHVIVTTAESWQEAADL